MTRAGFLLCLALPVSLPAQSPPPGLDQYVTRVMQTFEVPGLSLAIVKDGKVVLTRGYGVKKLGEPGRVDAATLFGIASNTKLFTATALALLVEEGKLEWDAPVIRYLPSFALSDPFVTRELTIRDLLVHRSGLGLGAGDLLWWPPTTYDRKEVTRRLRSIPLATSFRSAYAYDNVLYNVAGEVIAAVTGEPWEAFITRRILEPVGMRGSNAWNSRSAAGPNDAWPHARVEGSVRPIPPFRSDNVNPAGGINAGAEDMARWLIVQLDSGRTASGRLFSAGSARELWSIVTPIPAGEPPRELAPFRAEFNGYALGLGVRDYRGDKLLTHTGGLPGLVSRVAMVPSRRVGVAVLTNAESGAAFNAIAWWVLDSYLGVRPAYDWLTAYRTIQARDDSALAAAVSRAAAERDRTSRPSLPLERYAGTYRDAWYGDVVIARDGDGLSITFCCSPDLTGTLEHWQYDTFVARWRDRSLRADAFVTFALKPDGSIDQVKMAPFTPDVDFSFDFQDLLLTPVRTRE
jgi:CubicO group peptidase (beta-lactamase class C family)